MAFTDIFKVNQIKKELEACQAENVSMKKALAETQALSIVEIRERIGALSLERDQLSENIAELNETFRARKKDLVVLDDQLLLQSFGFYKLQYPFENSQQFKLQIETIREKQAKMIKNGKAAFCTTQWTVHDSEAEGKKMVADYVKLIVRSFNNECDATIDTVKFNNITAIENKIQKAYDVLNKLGSRMQIILSHEYFLLKWEELHLCYEYQVKKQQEKEEQKRLKEQMREEAKLLKEIEEEKLRIEKEQKHFMQALTKIAAQISAATSEEDKFNLAEKKSELEGKIAGLEKDKLNVFNREQNTRAGYVYIISNVGAFGENVYKIGVTRRLEPAERIDELGDASVPFDFDIHAMIFSDDAPKLEYALHKAFNHLRLNLINNRREFFKVSLDQIEAEVKKNFNKVVEFTALADAAEYRQSLMMKVEHVAPDSV